MGKLKLNESESGVMISHPSFTESTGHSKLKSNFYFVTSTFLFIFTQIAVIIRVRYRYNHSRIKVFFISLTKNTQQMLQLRKLLFIIVLFCGLAFSLKVENGEATEDNGKSIRKLRIENLIILSLSFSFSFSFAIVVLCQQICGVLYPSLSLLFFEPWKFQNGFLNYLCPVYQFKMTGTLY